MSVHTEIYTTDLFAPGEWDDAKLPKMREYLLALPGVRRIVREDIRVTVTQEPGTRVFFIVDEDGPDPDGDDAPTGPIFILSSPVDLVED